MMDALLVEVSRTIEAYRATDPGSSIDRIVLAGSAGIGAEVARAFERQFRTPTRLFEIPKSLRWRGSGDASGVAYSAAIGLALGSVTEAALHFDFLHPTEPEAERRERVKRVPMFAAAAAVVLVAAGVWAYRPIGKANAEIDAISAEIKKLNRGKKVRDAFVKETGALARWEETSVGLIDELCRLSEVLPSNQDAYISRLAFDDDGKLTIQLAATDTNVMKELWPKIEAIKDKDKPRYAASTSSPKGRPGDEAYPWGDTVTVTIKRLAPPDTKKRRR